MLTTLGHLIFRRRRWVLALAGVFVAVAVGWGTGVFGALVAGGFEDPDSESARAAAQAADTVGDGGADVVVLYESTDGLTVDEPAFTEAVEEHLASLPAGEVESTTTFWSTGGAPAFVSTDRTASFAVLQMTGADDEEREASYEAIESQLANAPPGFDLALGGDIPVNVDLNTQISEDIAFAETVSFPILLVLLLVVFGGLVAASLPLAIGALAVLGAFTVLRVITLFTDVSIFSVNIVIMLGLGLAIDYALFVVSRFREELRVGEASGGDAATVEAAVVRTMATAGRTVAFSGLTVAVALASLLLFPQVFLRSMGLGGMAAVLVAMVGALTVLPALLAVLGHRVNRWQIPFLRRSTQGTTEDHHGTWYRLARSVMRRPLVYVAVIVPVLLLLGSPFLRAEFGGVDYRALPEETPSRVVAETLDRDFPQSGNDPFESVVTFDGPADEVALTAYAEDVAGVPGVTGAEITGLSGDTGRVSVTPDADPQTEEARTTLAEVRDVAAPDGAEALVGGVTAELADLLSSLSSTLPWMALTVLLATLVLLFLAFGSVVLPIKAVVMNVLSLTASFGALVWIFQDGNLSGVLGFTPTGTIEATQPILMLAIAFGLSMDYEVFLLSRMRERWDETHDHADAVATGLQRSGRIITSAALLLVVVIGAFSTSGITFIKMIGVGLAIAIILDATVIRALLVPAVLRLIGPAAWWAPAPMARWWQRNGFRENAGAVPAPRAPSDAAEVEDQLVGGRRH